MIRQNEVKKEENQVENPPFVCFAYSNLGEIRVCVNAAVLSQADTQVRKDVPEVD